MNNQEFTIRNAEPIEFEEVGKLMVRVYSQLEGFPKETEQPDYYKMLLKIGELTKKPQTELLVAVSSKGQIAGGVVYFNDMQYYGSGGTATKEKDASGFRLLAVYPSARGGGIGKLLTNKCISKARDQNNAQVIILLQKLCRRRGKCMKNWVSKDLKTWILCRENFRFLDLGYCSNKKPAVKNGNKKTTSVYWKWFSYCSLFFQAFEFNSIPPQV